MANPNGTPTNLKPAWKPEKSGNPNGRPCVSAELKRMLDEYGDWPRNELMRLATDKCIKPETRARILMYLDEQFNGKAKQAVEQTVATKLPTLAEPLRGQGLSGLTTCGWITAIRLYRNSSAFP